MKSPRCSYLHCIFCAPLVTTSSHNQTILFHSSFRLLVSCQAPLCPGYAYPSDQHCPENLENLIAPPNHHLLPMIILPPACTYSQTCLIALAPFIGFFDARQQVMYIDRTGYSSAGYALYQIHNHRFDSI